jgi:hypothetical protein
VGARFVAQDAPGWRAIGSPAPRILLAAAVPSTGVTVELVAR